MTTRIGRLVNVKQRAVDEAAAALVAAQAVTAAAEQLLESTQLAMAAALDRRTSARTMADLVDMDAYARSLQKAVQRAYASLRARQKDEGHLMVAVTEARMELRRFEMWGERASATQEAVAARLARVAEDDLAARKRREA